MLQLFLVYFGPYYLFNVQISSNYRFIATIIGFSLNYSAYFAEIYRSGFASVSHGQYEACKMLGFNKTQTFFKIILPQVVSNVLPSVTNEVITLIKDTSLAFSISVVEMFTETKALVSATSSLVPYFIAMVIYYVFNYIIALLLQYIDKKVNKYRRV